MKSVIAIVGAVLLISVLAPGLACARSAPAPPSPSPATAAPQPSIAAAPRADPLAQIIEGAKKEGAVSATLTASWTPAPVVQLLRNNIKQRYGVDIDIKVTASGTDAADLARAIMEKKTGASVTYDLMKLGSDYIPLAIKEGVFEKLDWKALFPAGTAPEVVPQSPQLSSGPILYSTSTGLLYNSGKVPADQVPKTLSDLADPRWKGRLGVMNYPAYWARWAFILGKDKTLSTLRGILKNQPIFGDMNGLNNKYLLGEIDVVFLTSSQVLNHQSKGVPTAFRALDFLEIREYQLSVVSKAPHPNAATLLAVYLSSADGVKFGSEKTGQGNHNYPGSYEYDTKVQAQKDGVPVYTLANNARLLDFILSPEYDQWQKEIELIIKQGG